MNLFIKQKVKLSSGEESDFKIECDALTDEDIECIAHLIVTRMKLKFNRVVGVPTGGDRLAKALEKRALRSSGLPVLIVDDVFTTGRSMEKAKLYTPNDIYGHIGVVIFSRGKCPSWITPVFQMNIQ